MITGVLSVGEKRPGREDNYYSSEVKNGGVMLPLPHTSEHKNEDIILHIKLK
jgi:hypothetical protein